MHAIILVGGRGTRLQPLTDTRPKPMLPILGAPFLEHQLLYLKRHGVTAVTFACGFLPDEIRSYFGDGERVGLELTYALEPEPLDTAGAIAFAAREFGLTTQRLLVCNGDVLTDLDVTELLAAHDAHDATATIALTPVEDPTRYGLVRTATTTRSSPSSRSRRSRKPATIATSTPAPTCSSPRCSSSFPRVRA